MIHIDNTRSIQSAQFGEIRGTNKGGVPPEIEVRTHNARLMPTISEAVRSSAAFAGAAVSSPKIGEGVTYERQSGELFAKGGPRRDDIQQGALGDCYFLSALTAVVADNPEAVRDAIRNNHDGTYSVRFYDSERREVWVTVNRNLPTDAAGNLIYARGHDRDGDGQLELWVPIMEKAYAAYKDLYGPEDRFKGYEDIGRGGSASDAIQALTGKATRTEVKPSSAELLNELSHANTGAEVVVDTKKNANDGWVGSHSYTVIGVYMENGETLVRLRNPWGFGEPDSALPDSDKNDGIFDVHIEDLDKPIAAIHTDASNSPFDNLLATVVTRVYGLIDGDAL